MIRRDCKVSRTTFRKRKTVGEAFLAWEVTNGQQIYKPRLTLVKDLSLSSRKIRLS